jgi:phosphatidylserine/phosphatidylglycerophosphate/cardiolipin synthase-like enzyme
MRTVFPDNFRQSRQPITGTIAFSPQSNLENVDIRLILSARSSIDMAAYALTDRRVAAALEMRARMGVVERIYLDQEQTFRELRIRNNPIAALAVTPNVQVRIKGIRTLMHLKAYVVDRRILRSGSANLSPSGERSQDNDIIITTDPSAVTSFEKNFAQIWARPDNYSLHP